VNEFKIGLTPKFVEQVTIEGYNDIYWIGQRFFIKSREGQYSLSRDNPVNGALYRKLDEDESHDGSGVVCISYYSDTFELKVEYYSPIEMGP
jgi:hypothetical protein